MILSVIHHRETPHTSKPTRRHSTQDYNLNIHFRDYLENLYEGMLAPEEGLHFVELLRQDNLLDLVKALDFLSPLTLSCYRTRSSGTKSHCV
jgi:hypothetical protein